MINSAIPVVSACEIGGRSDDHRCKATGFATSSTDPMSYELDRPGKPHDDDKNLEIRDCEQRSNSMPVRLTEGVISK